MYSFKNEYPIEKLHRIRLSNGMTRTSEFTEEELIDAGWKLVSDKPECEPHELVQWNESTGEWYVRNKFAYEIAAERLALWEPIRQKRDKLLQESDITQLKDTPNEGQYSDVLTRLWAIYRQKLRDITKMYASPNEVVWPNPPTTFDAMCINRSQIALELEFYKKHGETMSRVIGETNV